MSVSKDMANVIDVTDKIDASAKDDKEVIEECHESIRKMIIDRDTKMKAAKEQLVEMLKVTADKYRTATGVMEAIRVLRMVSDGKMEIFEEIKYARDLAAKMVVEVSKLTERAESLGWYEMEFLLEGAYEEDFVEKEFSSVDFAFELMRLDLCRNVGPAAEDITAFAERVDEEIEKVQEKIDSIDKVQEKIDSIEKE